MYGTLTNSLLLGIRSYVGIIQIRYTGRSSELPLSLVHKLPVSIYKISIVDLTLIVK